MSDTNKIDCAYIISLKENIEQNEDDLLERFANLGIPAKSMTLFKAVVGTKPTVDFEWKLYPWKIENSDNRWWKRDVLPGEIGCALSHLSVWKDAHEKKYEKILILEEDFLKKSPYIFNKFIEELDKQEWDLCYLGRNKIREDKSDVSENLVIPDYSYCLHAYLLSKSGIEKLINKKFEDMIMPADEFIASTYCEHPREDLKFIERNIKALSSRESYIKQTSVPETSYTENIHRAKGIAGGKLILEGETLPILDDSDWEAWKKRYILPSTINKQWELLTDEEGEGIFKLPIFTPRFCKEVIHLAESNGKWTEGRHKHYPTNDMLLKSLEFNEIYQRVLSEIVYPWCIDLWKLEGPRWKEMKGENFIVKYSMDKQGYLSLHHDSSIISAVLSLNEDFEGGGTWFPDQKILASPPVGHVTVHPGLVTHRHGARPITEGVRYVLISFNNFAEAGTE
jgi:GR25 family glycosyltransferase involved in LPS biosynthesis